MKLKSYGINIYSMLFLGIAMIACGPMQVSKPPIVSGLRAISGSGSNASGTAASTVNTPSSAANGSSNATTLNTNAAVTGKVFYGIYMVGSTLENDPTVPLQYGAGESDLREIIAGYAALSPDQQQNVKILVAFGGADRQGWDGMKVADISCLTHDGADAYFGDDSCYLLNTTALDMSQAGTLTTFLNIYKAQSAGYTTLIFDFWGHGDGSGGMGFADVSKGNEHLSVQDFEASFISAGVKVDILSFDACLMASLEVLNAFQGIASYLVASEQEVPGIGFDYTDIIKSFGDSMVPLDIAKVYADTFIDGQSSSMDDNGGQQIAEVPQSSTGGGKTISVFDLSRTPAVLAAANGLVPYFGSVNDRTSLNNVIMSAQTAHQYSGATIDLVDFLQHWQSAYVASSGASTAANALIDAVQNGVVYIRQDGSEPFSHGLSMIGINTVDNWTNIYPDNFTYVSTLWDGYIRNFAAQAQADQTPPTIGPVSSCKSDDGSTSGHCLTASDNLFVDVSHAQANVCVSLTPTSTCLQIGAAPTKLNANGQIFIADAGSNTSVVLCDGACASTLRMMIIPVLADPNSSNTGVSARVNGINVFLAFNVDWTQSKINGLQVISTAADGTTSQSQLMKGDTIEISYNSIDAQGNVTTSFGAPMTIAKNANFTILPLSSPMVVRTSVQIPDLSGNSSSTVYND